MRKKKKLVTRETVRKLAGEKLGGAGGAGLVLSVKPPPLPPPPFSSSTLTSNPQSRVSSGPANTLLGPNCI